MAVNSRRLDGEVFMMGDWIGNSTTQHATMSRLLNLVCGDGDCSDPNVVKVLNLISHRAPSQTSTVVHCNLQPHTPSAEGKNRSQGRRLFP